jgi:hypothetical protein
VAEQFNALTDEQAQWIDQQPMFFVATAARDGRVNLSPKGQTSLKVIDGNRLLWLNLTGSGNETAAHLLDVNRITLMWCAFEGPPQILRAYGSATVIHPNDAQWEACTQLIPAPIGARQYFSVDIEMVQTSCGYAVPLMAFEEERKVLSMWSEKRGQNGIEDYWQEKNRVSIDGFPTGMPEKD